MLSVVNVRVRRSEVSDPSNAPFLGKTKVVSSESAKEMPTRWNLLSADVPLGASPDEVARETIAAHFHSGWVEGYSLDVMRKVNELDSSGLTRGNRAHLPGLATEGIRSTDADDAKRQLETCSQSKYPGLPCVYTVHLYEVELSGLPASPQTFKTNVEGLTYYWRWEELFEAQKEDWKTPTTIIFDIEHTLHPKSAGKSPRKSPARLITHFPHPHASHAHASHPHPM